MDLRHGNPVITNQDRLLWCEDRARYPSSASLIAGSRTSRSVSLPLPKVWTVSAHAAAAPIRMRQFRLTDPWTPPTWNSYTIEIGEWDLSPFDTTLADVFYVQIPWWPSRPIQCLDFLSLGIIEQAKCVPVNWIFGEACRGRGYTYPPIPQQLGSVTFNAADVATAASAVNV